MFPGRFHCKLILTVCLTAAMPALAKPGYLAALGPVPLRFLPPQRPAVRAGTMPTVNTEPATVRPGNETATAPKTGNPPAGPPPPMPAVTNEVNTAMPPLEPDAVVSPEMLLKYFNRSTNGASMEILAPLNVIPTRPSEPPSSKATYSN